MAGAIHRHGAVLAVGARASLRHADPPAIDAGLVLVADRVRAGVRHAGSAADVKPGSAGNEYAGPTAADSDAVRVHRGAVDAARPAAGALIGDADISNLHVLGIASGQRASARRACAGAMAECGRAVGTGEPATLVGVRGARGPGHVKPASAGEATHVSSAGRRPVDDGGAVRACGTAGTRRALCRARTATVYVALVPVPDPIGTRRCARAVRADAAEAARRPIATGAESAFRRAASAAVDVGLVAVLQPIRAGARGARTVQADPARAVARHGAGDPVRTSLRTATAAVDARLRSVPDAVAAGGLQAGAANAGQPCAARVVRVIADGGGRRAAAREQQEERAGEDAAEAHLRRRTRNRLPRRRPPRKRRTAR